MKIRRLISIFAILGGMILTSCSGGSKAQSSSDTSETSSSSSSQVVDSDSSSISVGPTLNYFDIRWINYDGTVLETDEHVLEGSIPSYDGATPTRNEDEHYVYTFSHWSPEIEPVSKNQTYMAVFSQERIKYTIDFNLSGGSSPSYQGPVQVESFTKDIFFFDCIKDNYNFRGWSYLGQKIFDEKGNQLANPVLAKNMTFVALFSQTAKLNIIIDNPDAGSVAGSGEYPYNTDVEITAEANTGYTFGGWYADSTLIASAETYKFRMWSQDVTIEARFINNYHRLKVWSNNVSNGKVLLKSETNVYYEEQYEEYRAYTSEVTVVSYSLNDTRFLGWFDKDNQLVDTNAIYSFVMPDDDYELEAKWNYFTINYELNGGTNDALNPTSYTLESETMTLLNPVKAGAEFLGWSCEGEYITQIVPSMARNLTLSAVWADIQYTLTVSKLSNSGNGTVTLESGQGFAREVIQVKATVSSDSIFLGWFDTNDNKLSTSLTYSFQMPSHDYEVVGHFQLRRSLGMVVYMNSEKTSFTYGLYPCNIVTDATVIAKLNTLPVESNGYRYYRGEYYAQKTASVNKHLASTTVISGNSYYFKCMPLGWKVLSKTGSYFFAAIANKIYEVNRFHNTVTDGASNNYENSSMRTYLNSTFKNKAFVGGNSSLRTYSVNNSAATTDSSTNPYASNNTMDMVFNFSYMDYRNTNYFTSANTEDSAATRTAVVTDWAAVTLDNTLENSYHDGYYWTRSPYSGAQDKAFLVSSTGALVKANTITNCGVRPGIYIYYS